MNRREFLWTAGAGAAAFAFVPDRLALAQDAPPARKAKSILVPVFLRGGADGLNMVVPHGVKEYYALRKSIAIPQKSVTDLDGTFGLHPALAALHPFFKNGAMAVVHAVGYPKAGRSHFEEMDVWETARPQNAVASPGWLNHFLEGHAASGPIRAVSFNSVLPRILRGKVPAQAVPGLGDLGLGTPPERAGRTRSALSEAYEGDSSELFSQTGKETLEALRVLGRIDPKAYRPAGGAEYPQDGLGVQFRQAAQLIKADVGVEVAELELGGWDTHQTQGGVDGAQANLMRSLATSIAAFLTDLGDRAENVLVVTLSEFGRTAGENGSQGTDHGCGNCLFLLGGRVKGGRLHGDWPGLGRGELKEGRELAVRVDFRDVLAEVLAHHLACADPSKVLGHEAKAVGLFNEKPGRREYR